MDDKHRSYMRWLEEMWDVQKFDIPGRTEREDRKKEEALQIFRDLVELSKCRIAPPDSPRLEPPPS